VVKYGIQAHDWKSAGSAAETMIAEAQTPKEQASAHYQRGVVLFDEGIDKHKQEFFEQAHEELGKALAEREKFASALFADGRVLAYLMQDDAAKERFQQFVDLKTDDTPERRRALRYLSEPALARARMAPPFEVTTVDGKKVSLDDLQGQVVLIDFWATWCGPCREAMPHIRNIAKEHAEDPLVVLSVSVDKDEKAWSDFIAANKMTWPQYFNGGFGGLAKLYEVSAIPNTFTIDADGVLQAEHVGDAGIDGKIRKLVARAKEEQAAQKQRPSAAPALQTRGEEEQ
jgi:thiol-disulfide isomerase/thioredoxin